MKNWKKIMAGLCAAAMVSSMVVPVWAAEETTEEAADDTAEEATDDAAAEEAAE